MIYNDNDVKYMVKKIAIECVEKDLTEGEIYSFVKTFPINVANTYMMEILLDFVDVLRMSKGLQRLETAEWLHRHIKEINKQP